MILSTNFSGILFASLTAPGGSESSTVNDWLQTQRNTQALSLISETVFSHRGVVTKSLKDGLIATFADASSALQAVIQISDRLTDMEANTSGHTVWRLGLHFAKLDVVAGSIAGEGLERTIELADKAEFSQTLVSAAMAEILQSGSLPDRVQLVPTTDKLADRSAILQLLVKDSHAEQEAPTAPLPVITPVADAPVQPPEPAEPSPTAKISAATAVLKIADQSYCLDPDQPKISVGRGLDNTVQIEGSHVSRLHGYFELKNGELFFIDQSANGSCLLADEQESHLHNERRRLTGEGEIGLGPTLAKSPEHLIHFSLVD